MAKIIKKIVRVLLITVAVLVTVPLVLFLLLQAPRIQTWTVNKITGAVSGKTGAEISIGRVSYSFRHTLVLDDLLFRDLNGDILLAAGRVDLRIREIRPSHGRFSFGRIDIRNPDFRLIQDTTGILNLTQYLLSLRRDGERDSLRTIDIRFADIDLIDGSFTLADRTDTAGVIPGSVNFKNMHLSHINGKVRDLRIIPDSVSMAVRGLAFTESGGFAGRSVDMNLAVAGSNLHFREIEIITDSSAISAEKILLLPRDTSSWRDFINEVRMDIQFNSSVVNTSDLAYFVRPLAGIGERVNMSGRLSGTVSAMKGRNVRVDYESATRLRFDFDISGLPSVSESYLFIDFTDMRTTADDIEKFTIPGRKPVTLPAVVHELGLISYQGSFNGFTTDFVSFGRLTTERGAFDTDLSLKPDGKNTFGFRGSLRTSDVDLGYIAGN
ncbi:MAG: hypothetical protein R2756_09335, partial [Bacteroidales bacterium]